MNSDRWRDVSRIYGAVLTKPPEARAAALDALCGADASLRRDVESLLQSDAGRAAIDGTLPNQPSVPGHPSPLGIGDAIGSFRIESLLGVGGMGEVYRAHDTKLHRDVAIKVLPAEFARDADRLARFTREAQVLASLNHPNIAHLYGLEGQDTREGQEGDIGPYLIMELVEGPTLADKIAETERASHGTRGLGVDESLAIARQVAEALEAAHEQGIIHRDLKPANIKVRDDGTVKVLDFGLAKIADPPTAGAIGRTARGAGGGEMFSQSPTVSTPAMTAAGIILGTAAYMSPEQAKGKPADRRSDIWAFGCVLFEMLTGRRPFAGDDVADTLAAVLRAEPDWSALPTGLPPAIDRLLRRTLVKEQRQRISDAAMLRLEIDESLAPQPTAVAAREQRSGARVTVVLAAAVATGAALASTYWLWRGSPPTAPPPELRVDISTPDTRDPTALAISPEGLRIVYALDGVDGQQLWLRDLASGVARPLEGTRGGTNPFWSPSGRSLGFFAAGRLKRIDLAGGPARDLARAPSGVSAGAFTQDGRILFSLSNTQGLLVVPVDGGDVREVTSVDPPSQWGHRRPAFLPDGKHFVFFASGERKGIYLGSLDESAVSRLFDADTSPVFALGHLLFLRGNTLFAQRFDSSARALVGEPVQLATGVASANQMAALGASATGTIAFRQAGLGDRRQLIWFDRTGRRLEALGDPESSLMSGVELSPDERQVASGRSVNNARQIFSYRLPQSGWIRVTAGDMTNSQPAWSPDGRRLAFISSRSGSPDVYVRPSLPGGTETRMVRSDAFKGVTDWTTDGRYIVFNSVGPGRESDVLAFSLEEQKVQEVAVTGAGESDAKVAPNGKWVAYQSDESGRFEVYVAPFLREGARVPVSRAGGAQARWRRDGRELFYVDLEEHLTAVPVSWDAADGEPQFGSPTRLFQLHLPVGAIQPGGSHQQYAVSRDGQRFLVNTLLSDPTPPITLILNWHPPTESHQP